MQCRTSRGFVELHRDTTRYALTSKKQGLSDITLMLIISRQGKGKSEVQNKHVDPGIHSRIDRSSFW